MQSYLWHYLVQTLHVMDLFFNLISLYGLSIQTFGVMFRAFSHGAGEPQADGVLHNSIG